jgi:peptidoglycan/LPS O-acetylase OafA/YrhL
MNTRIKKDKSIFFIQILCALLIVNYHTSILDIPYLKLIAKGGFILNTIFVFLSGYFLSISFSRSKDIDFIKFMLKRIKRIYPSLILVLLITLFYSLITSKEVIFSNYLKWFTGFGYFFSNNEIFSVTHLWFVSVIMVCYILFIPSYKLINKRPFVFITAIGTIFLLYNYLFNENALMIYNNISSDKVLRFLYHYMIFNIAIIWQVKSYNIKNFSYAHLITFTLSFLAYTLFMKSDSYSIVSVILVIPIILSLIPMLYKTGNLFEKRLPIIFKLSTIPYELYLIHYIVINSLNEYLNGNIVGYLLTFIISILLAFIIHSISTKILSSIEKLLTTKNIVHLADSDKIKDVSNK